MLRVVAYESDLRAIWRSSIRSILTIAIFGERRRCTVELLSAGRFSTPMRMMTTAIQITS
ncbi:hypothetical protein KP509_07G038200 [Ceratopteris richardii]|uniref:Uncharacterized protein n=1 Tax=Ceratopteris richardii TaxID=49495 RepID=A0A8T2UFX1_CERRI|nr:hypothetical protein KP509_07G038200 [Ceratopteris richardii]